MSSRIRDGLSRLPPLLDTKIAGHASEQGELCVRGFGLSELVESAGFEEVLHLLLYGELPERNSLARLSKLLELKEKELPQIGKRVADNFSGSEQTMDAVASCIAAIASTEKNPVDRTESYLVEKAISSVAWYSVLLSEHIRKRRGICANTSDKSVANFSRRFLERCFGCGEGASRSAYLEKFLVLACEQGLTASTFSARITASSRAGFFEAVIAAMQTWNGYRHGAASDFVCRDLVAIKDQKMGVSEFLQRKEKDGHPLFGFGHRRYKDSRDPRLDTLEQLAREAHRAFGSELYDTAQSVIEMAGQKSRISPNVELQVAIFLDALGFHADELPAVVFMGRLAGICAHIIEENGPMRPLLRGQALYTGKKIQPVPKRDQQK